MKTTPTTPAEASLITRVRAALESVPRVTEKKMFGSTAFLVAGKFCIAARAERLMCRIDPADQAELLQEKRCRVVTMKGRKIAGYVYVDAEKVSTGPRLKAWIKRALAQNRAVTTGLRRGR